MKRVKLYYLIMAILMVVSLLLVALRVPFSLDIVVFVMGAVFILAIVLGVDDYFNNLTTGNVMRPVADGHHISRAKLSYMCDATAAPVCITALSARLWINPAL